MYKIFRICVLTILFCAFSSGQIENLQLPFETFTLPNGLRVLLQPDQTQSEISVEFWIHMGAKDETPANYGFAHFFEHATPYGLSKDTESLAKFRIFRTNSNAQTKKDYTRYFIQVKPEGLEIALRYSADRLRADTSALSDATIEGHRKNVLAEFDRQEASPFWGPTAAAAREAGTFGTGDPYGHSSYGTRKANESFTKDEIRQWYQRHFYPANTILFVVGKFEVDVAKRMILQEFSSLPASHRPSREKRVADNSKNTPSAEISIPSKSNYVGMTWKIPGYSSNDIAELELLSELIDAKLKSANKRPLSLVATGSNELFDVFETAGEFGVYATFETMSEKEEIVSFLTDSLKELISKPISLADIAAAQAQVTERMRAKQKELGFIGSRTELLGEGLLFSNKPNSYLVRLKRQLRTSPTALKLIASKYLKKEPFTLFAVRK